jgi:hypothetical protein
VKSATAAQFKTVRDSIVGRLIMLGYPVDDSEKMANAAILAHVKSINHRVETCANLVKHIPLASNRAEALMIFLAMEAEGVKRHIEALAETADTQPVLVQ